jgi:hypothetical protein
MQRPWSALDTWEHVKANWEALQRTGTFQGVGRVVNATQYFCDESTRSDIHRFFDTHAIAGNERRVRQSLETIDRCIATRLHHAGPLAAFLERVPTRN